MSTLPITELIYGKEFPLDVDTQKSGQGQGHDAKEVGATKNCSQLIHFARVKFTRSGYRPITDSSDRVKPEYIGQKYFPLLPNKFIYLQGVCKIAPQTNTMYAFRSYK